MFAQIRPTLVSFIAFTVLTGVLYPAVVTGIANIIFPHEANGSVIVRDGKPIGSALIAQGFTDPKYFWPRPSAANYNAAGASGSNLGPTNPVLAEAIASRTKTLQETDPGNDRPVPIELVTASGSGLDPHISPSAARYQASRVARVRGLSAAEVETIIARHIERPAFGALGEPRVNVLLLNLDLDRPASERVATTRADELPLGGPALYRWSGVYPEPR